MWRSGYDMPADDFAKLTDKLWLEVKPLYDELHTYTRNKLNEKYGDAVQARTGPIRADLLGNMWAQEWGGIYPIVAPAGAGDIGYDIGDLLKAKGYDPLKMVHTGEGFFTSLGFAALPQTFYARSQITKPADREVVCHASAWNINNVDDLRIKMCTKVNSGDFVTIHHELGHNFYQRAYNKQSLLYMNGANDGFHEAIGDAVALSITPEYLRNSALDARNFFDQTIGAPPFKRNQFGGSLGGPLKKDKMFLFGNYEGFRQRLAVSSVAIVPDATGGVLSIFTGGEVTNTPLLPATSRLSARFSSW